MIWMIPCKAFFRKGKGLDSRVIYTYKIYLYTYTCSYERNRLEQYHFTKIHHVAPFIQLAVVVCAWCSYFVWTIFFQGGPNSRGGGGWGCSKYSDPPPTWDMRMFSQKKPAIVYWHWSNQTFSWKWKNILV